MQLTESFFTDSVISVKENVVKNVLFRASSIILQYAIFNFCAYIAYLSTEYTSFLMFAEDYVQRALFIASRGTNRSAIIVLVFTISYTLANLYDSLLWAVDSPGYVKRSKLVDGNTVSPFLLQNPSYVAIVNNLGHDLDRVDVNQSLTSNLFKPGFNFSFPPAEYARTPQAIMPPKPMDPAIGPRIFLDAEGFGLALNDILLGSVVDDRPCLGNDGGNGTALFWYCSFSNSEGDNLLQQTAGLLWARWSDVVSTPVNFERSDNPWTSYSTYGDTGVMKQVVTFTKNNKRHTFLHTVSKVSMLSKDVFPDDEIQTMLQRIYAPGGETDSLQLANQYAGRCLETQKNGTYSSTMGFTVQDAERPHIRWTSTEFFNNEYMTTRPLRMLRVQDVTIELIRSETISKPVQPLVSCDDWNANRATGGRVRWSDCSVSIAVNPSGTRFLGQIDISSVALIVDLLGDGNNNTNVVALNATGESWYAHNQTWIDQLLLSRAFLLGGDASTVNVLVYHFEAAISYLQLILVLIPFVLAVAASALMFKDKHNYYKSSLFASLATTAHLSGHSQNCDTAGYIKRPPNLVLQRVGEHTRIGTEDGAYVMSSYETPGRCRQCGRFETDIKTSILPNEKDDVSVRLLP